MRQGYEEKTIHGTGIQRIYKFANGFGASVVRHQFSYGSNSGLWELAVLKDGKLTYRTPITSDVMGWLGEQDVDQILSQIEALPKDSENA